MEIENIVIVRILGLAKNSCRSLVFKSPYIPLC
jgi:hypothetical protein